MDTDDHVTRIDTRETVNYDGNHPSITEYTARCSCGWRWSSRQDALYARIDCDYHHQSVARAKERAS